SDRGAVGGGDRRAVSLWPQPLFRQPVLSGRGIRLTAMSMQQIPRQLALALDHAESFAREDFLSGPCNAAALALIDRWPDWPGQTVALVGPEGAGKSHLAAIWAGAAGARFLAARGLATALLPGALATGALGGGGNGAGQVE